MDVSITRCCLSLLLLTLATSAGSNETSKDEPREPRVSGRIVKLYSGAKPEPYICTGEGFQADYNNCAVFYRCVKEKSGKFTVFRYQCAPGTVYDPDLETCNHPRSTRRSECGGILKPTVQPSRLNNINEIDGAQSEVPKPISTKVPIYTEQTTAKNPTTLSWMLPTERQSNYTQVPWALTTYQTSGSVDNVHDKTTKSVSFSTGSPWSSMYQTEYHTKKTSPPKTIQQSNSKNNDPCTSDGFMGDSDNCRKFYRCVGNQRGGYVKYEFSCSELTVWDDEIQGCNHPWAVKRSKCGRSMSYVEKSEADTKPIESSSSSSTVKEPIMSNGGYGYKSNKTVQHQLQISNGPQVTQTQTQISNSNDVIQNQTQIHYGDKLQNNNKSKFVSKQNQTQISFGTAVSQTQTQIDYGNKGVQTQLQIDHSKDSSQSQVQIQDTTTVQSATKPQSNNENSECSESGFIGDNNDCKKFYRCVNNGKGSYTKYEYVCGDGTVWDPEIEACNHAWAVKHCGGKLPPDTESDGYTTTSHSTIDYHTEATRTTQSYTTSQLPNDDDEDDIGYGNQNNQETLPSSTSTSKPTTTSKISTTTTSEQSNEVSTECKSSGFIGDANNCKLFYRCVDNGRGDYVKYEFKCGDGTLWDPDIEACNHAWAVKKCGGISSSNANNDETTTQKDNSTPPQQVQTTVTLTQITSQAPTENDDYDTGYGSQNHEPSTSTVKTTKLPQGPDNSNNECKSSGFMGDQNDCKKFYRCVDNGSGGFTRYEFTCGEGTVWDPKIEACNHAWAVDKCGKYDVINSIETTSLSAPSTIYDQTSSSQTTQVIKDTDGPVFTSTTTAKTTTAGSVSSSQCTTSGFVGDDADCKKFYRCVDNGDGSYTRYEFTCGEGTVWDPDIEACNHAWAVKKCGGHSKPTPTTQQTTSQHPVIQDEEQENGYGSPSYETSEYPQITTTLRSSSTTSALSESVECNNSGFMGDRNNCKKFYRCVDNGKGGYDRYEFQCGEGTVWDSSIEACNHAWAVKDCGTSVSSSTQTQNESTTQTISSASSDGQTQQLTTKPTMTTEPQQGNEILSDECAQEGFFGNQQDCKKFYRCVDNGKGGYTKYDFTCGEGTSWNPDIQGCDHANPSRPCSTKPSQEPIYLNDDMDTSSTTTAKTTTSSEENQNINTTKKPESSEGSCESEGFYGNPSDCKKFYRCVDNGNGGFTKYDFNCGQGTVWNQEIQACDHESTDETCISSYPDTESPSNQSESTTSSYSTTKKQQTTDKTESSENMGNDCTSEGFFAHPNNCKKFVRCVNNGKGGYTRYEFSCGDGTVWVQEIQACDHDNGDTSCNSQNESTFNPQHTEQQSTSVTNVMSSTDSITPSREDDEYDNETPKEPSQDKCESEGYFANKEDCRKFYRCVDNGNGGYTKYDFVCGDGTAWDQNLQTCNHINEVESCNGNNQQGESVHTTTNKNQAETESTSSTTKSTPSSESSSSASNSQDTCESEGYYGDSKDCKKFYRCVDNGKGGYTKYDFTCGDGTIWDQDITNCNHPQDVSKPSCDSNQESSDTSSTTSTTTISPSQTSSAATESSSSNGQSTSDCSEESSKKPPNNNVTCEKAGYYENPNDCKKFYRCVDWDGDGKRFSVFHFECGEGTIWDPALDTCNHEDSVYPQRDCSQTQSQNVGESTSEGTTSTTTSESTTSEQTTQESTTSQQTTTQESITSEQTTTQQSATETTTTQESTTSEQTTTQQTTTSEKTTTQEPATTEHTTTQQTTTSEKTTTQEPTTTEQTTTQQTTTSEKTTTQEQTTSELITTEQTTTSDQTTTQEQTTSELTTTQQSTTSEQTTTQQSTTSDQSTTQESTTNEQTTTQESSTSEQTTTQESTSEQSTTQESTTSEQTTQQITTTEGATTEGTTTEGTTTEGTTTEGTTTEGTTTEGTTTEGTTTEGTTTEGTTTTEDSTNQTQSTESSATTEEPSTSGKECPETDDDQYLLICPTSFRRHPKYCNMFYQCTEDDETYEAKVAMFKCPNNTIYDDSQTQCVTEDKADKKCDGEIANKRRFKRLGLHSKDPIIADKGKLSCSTDGYFSFEKKTECSKGFLKCEKNIHGLLKGHVYQCPDGYIYWSISKRCERIESVRDCKRSSNDWSGRWNIPVERKNVAAS